MSKTAMMELIEFIDYIKESEGILTSHEIKEKAFELLAKEKEQIVDAHKDGQADLLMPQIKEMSENQRRHIAETYFTKRYKLNDPILHPSINNKNKNHDTR